VEENNNMISLFKKILPEKLQKALKPRYHYALAFISALVYRFPSREIKIIAITGTKGKTSTAEIVNSILEEAGLKTALAGTLRFKIGDESVRNMYKMTMPGRFFLQKFIRKAVKQKCDWIVLEMTSEGVKQFRHKFIALDALILTNISPEHIESHGSYKNYIQAKFQIAKSLEKSNKKRKVFIVNGDNEESRKFLSIKVREKYIFSKEDAIPYQERETGILFSINNTAIQSRLHGEFNLYNMLAGIAFAQTQDVSMATIKTALENFIEIPGRRHVIAKDPFEVVIDYAHTIDSLEQLYKSFKGKLLVGVLGNTGGGRDVWKRPGMARTADTYCAHVVLTNEDPYDEDPKKIIADMVKGFQKNIPEVILDRREAIKTAFKRALKIKIEHPDKKIAVLITGKGTDPYIMGASGNKTPWDDATVALEELRNITNIQ